MTAPPDLCAHYWPGLVRGCNAGRRSPHDCRSGCASYLPESQTIAPGAPGALHLQQRRSDWAVSVRRTAGDLA